MRIQPFQPLRRAQFGRDRAPRSVRQKDYDQALRSATPRFVDLRSELESTDRRSPTAGRRGKDRVESESSSRTARRHQPAGNREELRVLNDQTGGARAFQRRASDPSRNLQTQTGGHSLRRAKSIQGEERTLYAAPLSPEEVRELRIDPGVTFLSGDRTASRRSSMVLPFRG